MHAGRQIQRLRAKPGGSGFRHARSTLPVRIKTVWRGLGRATGSAGSSRHPAIAPHAFAHLPPPLTASALTSRRVDSAMPSRFSNRSTRRFLRPEEQRSPRGPAQARGNSELFGEGPWQAIRVVLEAQGWSQYQIERIHDQLRQGWPLAMAKQNVASITGQCPLRARPRS
jgi:hypothetical protein